MPPVNSGKPEKICQFYFSNEISKVLSPFYKRITKIEEFSKYIKAVGSIMITIILLLTGFFWGQGTALTKNTIGLDNLKTEMKAFKLEVKEQLERILPTSNGHVIISPKKQTSYCDLYVDYTKHP